MFSSIFIILFLLIITTFVVDSKLKYFRFFAILGSSVVQLLSLNLLNSYDLIKGEILFNTKYTISFTENLNFTFFLDGISLLFFFLTSWLIFSIVIYLSTDKIFKDYCIKLFLIQFFLFIAFSTRDLLIFYISYEAILIPMFLIVGTWGSRERKIRANLLLLFYTLAGSILMFIAILYIFSLTGTTNIDFLLNWNFTIFEKKCLWIAFAISFATKIPVFPFHIWLPEAHVEAPTIGSVLLAGLLLKLGVYGYFRFNHTLFPELTLEYSTIICVLSSIGVLYSCIVAIRQTDIKRITAYSSISHMNLVVCGMFACSSTGMVSAIFQSLSHGFVSGSLFFLIGSLYQRYHSRDLNYYGGLVHTMPLFSFFFFFFTIANIGFPLTSSFVGEFLLMHSIYQKNFLLCFMVSLSVIFGAGVSLYLFNRSVFGNIKNIYLKFYNDLESREIFTLVIQVFMVLLLGVYPSYFIPYIELSVLTL